MEPARAKNRIAILGAGYAGMKVFHTLLNWLRPHEAEVTLINRDRYHWFTTRLHSFAAGEEEGAIRVPLQRGLRPPGRLLVGKVEAIKPAERTVVVDGKDVPYDYLVIALGSIPEFFGVPGAREHSMTIQQPQAATAAREAIARLLTQARMGRRPHLVVAGGGLTGIELAGEVSDASGGRVAVTVVEGASDLLPGMEPYLSRVAQQVLVDAGVKLELGVPITRVEADRLVLKDGREVPMDLLVWAGGVSGHPLLVHSGLPLNRRDRALVDSQLHSPVDDRVYIVGDCAAFPDPKTGRDLPPTAQNALQMGEWCARNLLRRLTAKEELPFVPQSKGVLASIGKGAGVGQVGQAKVRGLPALLVKNLVEAHHAFEAGGMLSLLHDLWHLPARFKVRRHSLSPTAARLAASIRGRNTGRAAGAPTRPAPVVPRTPDAPGTTPPMQ